MATATKESRPAQDASSSPPDPRRSYHCPECDHVLRVSGLGRHRVYFELDDERRADPVMNRACPACGHGLGANGRALPSPESVAVSLPVRDQGGSRS